MDNTKSKYSISRFLFVAIYIVSNTAIFSNFIVMVMEEKKYYDSWRIGVNPWNNCVDDWDTKGFWRFITYIVSIGLVVVPILAGAIASYTKNDKVMKISVIVYDAVCLLTLLTRFTKLGFNSDTKDYIDNYFDDKVKLQADAVVAILLAIALTVVLFTNVLDSLSAGAYNRPQNTMNMNMYNATVNNQGYAAPTNNAPMYNQGYAAPTNNAPMYNQGYAAPTNNAQMYNQGYAAPTNNAPMYNQGYAAPMNNAPMNNAPMNNAPMNSAPTGVPTDVTNNNV